MKRSVSMLVFLALAVLLAGGFVRLGLWQLDRAEQKERLLADFEQAHSAAPTPLDRWRPMPRYQPVVVTGRFQAAPLILLDNQVREGRPGIEVLQVFQPAAGGEALLVNRGWLPVAADRSAPSVLPRQDRADLPGLLRDPLRWGVRLGEVSLHGGPEPQRVPWIDLEALAAALKTPLAPQILLSTEVGDDPLLKDWQPRLMPPDRHRAYAFQWFCLAATVLVVWLVLHRRTVRTVNVAH